MAYGFFYLLHALKNCSLSREKILKIQLAKLKEIVKYAYSMVPYYKKSWNKLDVNIKKFSDIKKLTPIDKKTVLENYNDMVSVEYKKYINKLYGMPSFLFMRSTSGTSGRAVKIYFNPDAKFFLDAIYARALIKVGYNPRKPLLYYWWQQTPQKELYHSLGFFKKIYVPSKWNEEQQIEFMQKIKPEYIYYYPSALYLISRKIFHESINLQFKPKLIITHAELLCEKMRENIEKAFDSKVYDQYGSNEFNRIAWECKERNGYHVDADSVFVEIVDENYEDVDYGECGRILITGLVNKAIPLIRYEIGDFARRADVEQEKHKCGISLPVQIKSIEGRYEHSEIKRKKIISQKFFLEKILDALDSKLATPLFQCFVDSKNKKIIINCVCQKFPSELKTLKILGNTVSIKKVRTLSKNKKTGKLLLVEKL